MWLPIALPINRFVTDQNLATILTTPVLYAEFILLVALWGRFVYRQPNLFKVYGYRQPRRTIRNLIQGLAIGLMSLFVLFAIQSAFGWIQWQAPPGVFGRIVLEGGIVAIVYGFAEETLFRGWLLNELERGYSDRTALWISSLVFALLHGIRPQFWALLILGMILVWAKRATAGRLGLSIGLHAGLVWGWYLVNVGQLVKFSSQVPAWITGIDHNPLAGLMGILALSAIALWVRQRAIAATSKR